MADAPKKGASALYSKPPKIEPVSGDGDKNKSARTEKAMGDAEKTAGDPKPSGDMTHGSDAKGDVMAGTDGIPTHHHAQNAERSEMHHRHILETVQQHGRQQQDHLMRAMGHHAEDMSAMHQRHHSERRTLHTTHEREMKDTHSRHEMMGGEGPSAGMTEKRIGNAGTEK